MGNLKLGLKSGIIVFSFLLFLLIFTIPVWADTFQFEETSLYSGGNAASIHIGPDGKVFVVDGLYELWEVNGLSGQYNDYYPVGTSNLADITFSSSSNVWWSNNLREFGSSDLSGLETYEWSIPSDTFSGDLNLGPITFYGDKIWLPAWYSATYGLFQFDPNTKNLCLYSITSGLFASDITVLNNQLWMLDWRGDGDNNQLLVFNPTDKSLVRFNLNRDVGENAQIFVDSGILWWTEDTLNGGIVRFVPAENNQGEMTIYSLPNGTYPRNLFVQEGQVWFSDVNGAFGHLDTTQVPGTTTVIPGSDPIILTCGSTTNLGTPDPYSFYNFGPGTFTWSTQDSTVDTSNIGLQVYDIPDGPVNKSSAYGIAIQNDYIWVSDAGRQKLIRMPVPPINSGYEIYLPLLMK